MENSSVLSFWVVPAVAPNCRALPLVGSNLCWWVGCSQTQCLSKPTTGTKVRLVCTLSSPLQGAGLTVEWCGPCLCYMHTARLVVLLQWIWHISWGGSARCTVVGGAGLVHFAVCGPLQHRWGGRPVGGMDPQKHSIGHLCSASKFSDVNWFPLEFQLGNGRGRWSLPVPLFPGRGEFCLPGLNNSPSWNPLALLTL